MAERDLQQSERARDELRRMWASASQMKSTSLIGKKVGSISDDEFTSLRAQLVQYRVWFNLRFLSSVIVVLLLI